MKKEQIHGGDIYRNPGVTDFSVNSNPLGVQKEVLSALKEQLGEIAHYPDIKCEALIREICRFEQVEEEQVLCGNGAAELFFAAAFALKPKHVLLPVPSFAEYERSLRSVDAVIHEYTLREEQDFLVTEEILQAITPEMDLLILCNPNNPTGQVVERPLLLKILKRCKEADVTLLLDECFVDFLDLPDQATMTGFLNEYPNLLIVKAFTKIFCMPGLRLGYGLCSDPGLLEEMDRFLQPWNVSVPAQIAGVAAMKNHKEYLEETRMFLKEEREKLRRQMEELGDRVIGSRANYLFFASEKGLYEKALEAGFLIRNCGNYRGLGEGYYRIASGQRKKTRGGSHGEEDYDTRNHVKCGEKSDLCGPLQDLSSGRIQGGAL